MYPNISQYTLYGVQTERASEWDVRSHIDTNGVFESPTIGQGLGLGLG